jgi:ABC-type antimicrobial peptide transport system permease subunit
MLKININQEKQLTFEVQIGGVNHDQISSQFKIAIGEVAYTFPAKVTKDEIIVNLPPLHNVIGTKIKEGDEAEITLEIVADGHLLTPWKDKAILSNPLVIEATIKDTDFVPNPAFQANLIVKDDGAKQITTIEHKQSDENKKSNITSNINEDEIINNIFEKISSKLESIIESKKNNSKEKEDENMEEEIKSENNNEKDEKMKDVTNKKITNENKNIESLLNKTIDTFKLSESKKMTIEDFKNNLSKKDIMNYMYKKGTKNTDIQEIIYEQARLNAKKDEPVYILKEVYKILKKN